MAKARHAVVQRYHGNPILTPDDMPILASGVYNAGAVKLGDQYLLMLRVETIDIKNVFWVATSDDGYHFTLWDEPVPMPDTSEFREHTSGMYYDPRITPLEGHYYITFAAHSDRGVRIALMRTDDFRHYEWLGFISEPDNRNAVLFPEKFGGYYVRLDRPIREGDQGDIWISYSPDLIHWGNSKCVIRAGGGWGWKKIGAGAPPIKTDQGWLEIFHAVHVMVGYQYVYHLGVMLLDLNDPSRVIARGRAPILSPRESYERVGLTPNVVFTCGVILESDGEVKIYYGAADTVLCLGTARLEDLIAACFDSEEESHQCDSRGKRKNCSDNHVGWIS